MDRTREKLEKLKARVKSGRIKDRDKIIRAAERILGKNHGQRYYAYELNADGTFEFSECKSLNHEKRIEGKYVIATAEKSLDVHEAVAIYKDLADVERGFRQLKDVLALRPIYHQVEPRVRAHIFVAALALLVQRLLDRRLREAGIEFSSIRRWRPCPQYDTSSFEWTARICAAELPADRLMRGVCSRPSRSGISDHRSPRTNRPIPLCSD